MPGLPNRTPAKASAAHRAARMGLARAIERPVSGKRSGHGEIAGPVVIAAAEKSPAQVLSRLILHAGLSRDEALELLEREIIIASLEDCGGNICHAARRLGVHRNTLTRRLSEFQLGYLPGDIRRRESVQASLAFSELRKPNQSARMRFMPSRRAVRG